MSLQPLLESLLGTDVPVRVTAYDGSSIGPPDAPATVVIRNPAAVQRIVTGLGREIAFARAYVAGDVDIDGDIYAVLALRTALRHPPPVDPRDAPGRAGARSRAQGRAGAATAASAARRGDPSCGDGATPRCATPGRSRSHYDVSNDFYRMVLGPVDDLLVRGVRARRRPTRAGAVQQVRVHLPQARAAARTCGCSTSAAVGAGWCCTRPATTASRPSASPSRSRRPSSPASGWSTPASPTSSRSGSQDYRDVHDGPYDAVSSIGMFEHVGARPPRRVLRADPAGCCGPEAGCSTTASAAPARQRRARSAAAASSIATCSPTVS